MNNDMKCPICNDGKIITYLDGTYECDNPECSIYNGTHTETFEALIRTRKALDVAKDTIRHADWFFDGDYNVDAKTMHNEIKYAIKALEQKD